jgi:O-methyltransferase domain
MWPAPVLFGHRRSSMVTGQIAGRRRPACSYVSNWPWTEEAPPFTAEATGSHTGSLRRLLKFLASVGVFSEDDSGKYHQTPLSDTLRKDHPTSLRGSFSAFGSEYLWRAFGNLSATIATGQPAFNHVFGVSFFEYLATHPDDAASFNEAMTASSALELPAIVAAYDFSHFERIVDVGGGQGALLHGILLANPKLRGVLFDLPSVVAGATPLMSGPVAPRCEVAGRDFFQAVPGERTDT